MEWRKVDDNMPTEDIKCLVLLGGNIEVLTWCSYYQSWDDYEGDDHFCRKEDIEFYIPFCDLPKVPSMGGV